MQMTIFNRVTIKDRAFIARQIATMLDSGLTLDKSLKILKSQTHNLLLKITLKDVIADLEAGKTFSEALKKHPRVFDRVFINIVISGEAVGKLSEVLLRLAEQLDQQHSFISKIKSALYYPVFIIFIMIIMIIVMMLKVIPPLKEVFAEFEADLPWTTTTLLSVSNFVTQYWVVVFGILGFILFFLIYLSRTKQGKKIFDRIAIDYTMELGKDIYMARFSRTLGMLVKAGTPIIEAIDITSEVINNIIYRQILRRVSKQVERGVPISTQLEKNKDFPLLVPQMISVGEKTGQLEKVLDNLAQYYEGEVDAKIKGLTSLFEPVIIIFIGLGVAFIVFSIIMPIYQIAELS